MARTRCQPTDRAAAKHPQRRKSGRQHLAQQTNGGRALLTGVGLKLIDIATPRQARTDGRLSRWWVAVDVAAALAGVAALDLLVETF